MNRQVFQSILLDGQTKANLVSDAHLAALAIEYGCTLYSTDFDFSRFPKLKWKNPLKKKIVSVTGKADTDKQESKTTNQVLVKFIDDKENDN